MKTYIYHHLQPRVDEVEIGQDVLTPNVQIRQHSEAIRAACVRSERKCDASSQEVGDSQWRRQGAGASEEDLWQAERESRRQNKA